MIAKKVKSSAAFEPVTLEITLETEQELIDLHNILNHWEIVNCTISNFSGLRAALIQNRSEDQLKSFRTFSIKLKKAFKDRLAYEESKQ